jgi:hypothetical protein
MHMDFLDARATAFRWQPHAVRFTYAMQKIDMLTYFTSLLSIDISKIRIDAKITGLTSRMNCDSCEWVLLQYMILRTSMVSSSLRSSDS